MLQIDTAQAPQRGALSSLSAYLAHILLSKNSVTPVLQQPTAKIISD